VRNVAVFLIIFAFLLVQTLIGGAKQLYCIPTIGILALAGLTVLWPGWKAPKTISALALITTLCFVGYVLARSQMAPVNYLARTHMYIVLGCLLVYLLTLCFVNENRHRGMLIIALLVSALAQVVMGAVQFKRGDQFMLLPWVQRIDDWWRASGFFISPNHYSGFLEIVALFAFAIVLWSRWPIWGKMLTGYVGLMCVAGIAISGSRGGYLSFAAGCVALATFSLIAIRKVEPRRFMPALCISVAGLVMLLGSALWFMSKSEVIGKRVQEINDPANMRWQLWEAALTQFQMDKTWGTGSGTYYYLGRQLRHATVQNDPVFVHNDYLHLLCEYGMVGAALFLLFFAAHAVMGWRGLNALAGRLEQSHMQTSTGLAFQIGALSALVDYVVHSVVDFNLQLPANAFVMAFVLGILANPAVQWRRRAAYWPATVSRILLPFASLAVFVVALPRFPGEYFTERARMFVRDAKKPEDFDAARSFAKRALEYDKINPFTYYYAGEAARIQALDDKEKRQALNEEAVRWYESGLRTFPYDINAVLKLARTFDTMGLRGAAEAQLTEAQELDPNLSSVYSYFGLHYHEQGLLGDAADQYEQALELNPNDEVALMGRKTIQEQRAKARAEALQMRKTSGDVEMPDAGDDSDDVSMEEDENEDAE